VRRGAGRAGAAEVLGAGWLEVHVLAASATGPALPSKLGRGEDEAIALALQLGGRVPLVIDDRAGRKAAEEQGLTAFGSAAVLPQA
jgi:predicted nucleic acid-binding protein